MAGRAKTACHVEYIPDWPDSVNGYLRIFGLNPPGWVEELPENPDYPLE